MYDYRKIPAAFIVKALQPPCSVERNWGGSAGGFGSAWVSLHTGLERSEEQGVGRGKKEPQQKGKGGGVRRKRGR